MWDFQITSTKDLFELSIAVRIVEKFFQKLEFKLILSWDSVQGGFLVIIGRNPKVSKFQLITCCDLLVFLY